MKIRKIEKKGYDNGVSLAKAWDEEGLVLYPGSGQVEAGYLLSDKKSSQKLGYAAATKGVNENLLEVWHQWAREQGRIRFAEELSPGVRKDF